MILTIEEWNAVQKQAARMMLQGMQFVIVKANGKKALYEVCELRDGVYYLLPDFVHGPQSLEVCQMIIDCLKKQGMVTIELPEQHTPCIIIEKETGVSYTTQTGGTVCAHPLAEGYLFLLTYWDCDLAYKLTEDLWYGRFGELFFQTCREMDKAAKKDYAARLVVLKELLSGARDGELNDIKCVLDVERAKSQECGEAWLPVICTHGKGWLTWPNSD